LGIKPILETQPLLFDHYFRLNNLERCVEVISQLMRNNIKRVYIREIRQVVTLIDSSNIEKVERLLTQIVRDNIPITSPLFWNKCVGAYAIVGQFEKALDVVVKMEKVNATPDTTTFNELIGGFLRFNKLSKVWDLLKVMEKSGVQPDLATLHHLLQTHFCQHENWNKIWNTVRKMKEKGIQAGTTTLHALLKHTSDLNRTWDIIEKMHSMDVKPTYITLNMTLERFERAEQIKYDGALEIVEKMKKYGVEPNRYTENILERIKNKP